MFYRMCIFFILVVIITSCGQQKALDMECRGNLSQIGKTITLYQMEYGRGIHLPPMGKDLLPALVKLDLLPKEVTICPVHKENYEVRLYPIISTQNADKKAMVWCKKDTHKENRRNVLYQDSRTYSCDEERFQQHMAEVKKSFGEYAGPYEIDIKAKKIFEQALQRHMQENN